MLGDHRYPKKAHTMLLALKRQHYSTRACKVRNVLYMFGFGIAWEMQSVVNAKVFLREFKQRLIDFFSQDWNASLDTQHTGWLGVSIM